MPLAGPQLLARDPLNELLEREATDEKQALATAKTTMSMRQVAETSP